MYTYMYIYNPICRTCAGMGNIAEVPIMFPILLGPKTVRTQYIYTHTHIQNLENSTKRWNFDQLNPMFTNINCVKGTEEKERKKKRRI